MDYDTQANRYSRNSRLPAESQAKEAQTNSGTLRGSWK